MLVNKHFRATSDQIANIQGTASLSKNALAVSRSQPSEAGELRDATFASLEGQACTEAAQALTDAVYERVLPHLIRAEAIGTPKTNRKKLKVAISAFLADLLSADEGWVFRSLKKDGFTGGRVGAAAFISLQQALRELGLVEHREGVGHWVADVDLDGVDHGWLVARRWASRYRATAALISLAAEHGISPANALDHFDYGLPKDPLQKRAASTRDDSGRKLRGKILKFRPSNLSRKLEAEVRELNEFLAKQTFGGGCVHRGYLRIFQNGDDPLFNWDRGGRLYSQPANTNYQQQSSTTRLEMTINDSPVVEIDLRASYLTIFYAWHGMQLDPLKDPYVVPELGEEARPIVKLWVAATFGNTAPLRKWPSDLLKNYEEEHKRPLDRKRYSLSRLREKVVAHHPILDLWGKPMHGRVRTWADLMFDESRVIVDTMLWLLRQKDIPSLAVHDSLIVAQQHEELAMKTLKAVYRAISKSRPLSSSTDQLLPKVNRTPIGVLMEQEEVFSNIHTRVVST